MTNDLGSILNIIRVQIRVRGVLHTFNHNNFSKPIISKESDQEITPKLIRGLEWQRA